MAYIKTLKDNELIGGTDNTDVYPISTTQAIYSQNADGTIPQGIKHQRLEERLQDHESDAQELHRKAEKMVAYLTTDKAYQTVEITGDVITLSLSAYATIETFGDEPAEYIKPADMSVKNLEVVYSSASLPVATVISGNYITGTTNLPSVVGTYTAKFNCKYKGTEKNEEVNTYLNLRKYFGFADEQPVDVANLDASDFSNEVECKVVIPEKGTGFKRIYFAVPNNMVITRVTQSDALDAPLAIEYMGTVQRFIGSTPYTYRLYQSVDLIDATSAKPLTIE